jgi:hypothetical protein
MTLKPLFPNAGLFKQVGRWLIMIGLMGWLWMGGGASIPAAAAAILRTADTADAIVVQSRRTLWDAQQQSWQVIAFKRIQPHTSTPTALRIVGFPDRYVIDHPQPLSLSAGQAQTWSLADRSDQIVATPATLATVGQYDLQSVLFQLPAQRLQLELPLKDHEPIALRVSPGLIQEWQQIAQVEASQLVDACEQFPRAARQHPDFPAWTQCRLSD